jgi:hypothetical protein
LDYCWFSADKLKEDDLKFWFPIIELVLIFTQIYLYNEYFLKTKLEINNQIEKAKEGDQAAFTFLLIKLE